MKLFGNKNLDLTKGNIVRSMIIYAIPVIISSLMQVLFNAADLAVVGNMGSKVDVAAVGAPGSVVGIILNLFIGLSAGSSVVIARYIGERNDERVKKASSTTVITALGVGVIMVGICLLLSKPLLRLTNCPDDCFDGAALYLSIYAFGIPASMLYNYGSAIIRTAGDTQRPLFFVIIAGVVNVVFNIIGCLVLREKVAAVAIATIVSQYVSAILTLRHLCRMEGPCAISLKQLSFSFGEFKSIVKIGLPCGFNNALFSIANLQVSAVMNSFGSDVIAGVAAASTIEGIACSFFGGFNATTLPFVGQNIGAGNRQRVKQSIVASCLLSFVSAVAFAAICYLFAHPLLKLFLPEGGAAVEYAIVRMRFVLLPYFIVAVYSTLVSSMQAFGYSIIPTINSIVTVLVFRVLYLSFIYPILDGRDHNVANVFLCFPVSWTLCLMAHSVAFFIIYFRYRKGKVKKV